MIRQKTIINNKYLKMKFPALLYFVIVFHFNVFLLSNGHSAEETEVVNKRVKGVDPELFRNMHQNYLNAITGYNFLLDNPASHNHGFEIELTREAREALLSEQLKGLFMVWYNLRNIDPELLFRGEGSFRFKAILLRSSVDGSVDHLGVDAIDVVLRDPLNLRAYDSFEDGNVTFTTGLTLREMRASPDLYEQLVDDFYNRLGFRFEDGVVTLGSR